MASLAFLLYVRDGYEQISYTCRTWSQNSSTEVRCVIKMMVLLRGRLVIFCMKRRSVSASSADVDSSNSSIDPGRRSERAMAIRWACPSLRPPPCSLHALSIPSGNCSTKSAHAMRNTSCNSSSVAFGRPKSRFSRMVPLKSVFPCGTYIRLLRVRAEASTSCS